MRKLFLPVGDFEWVVGGFLFTWKSGGCLNDSNYFGDSSTKKNNSFGDSCVFHLLFLNVCCRERLKILN